MPVVEVPGVGNVPFPDDMKPADIAAAIRRLQPAEQPGHVKRLMATITSAVSGLIQGGGNAMMSESGPGMALAGAPINTERPPQRTDMSDALAKLVVPQSATDIGIMAGTMGGGGIAAKAGLTGLRAVGTRVLGSTVGGAGGGATDDTGAGYGGLMGLAGGLLGETIGAGVSRMMRGAPGARQKINDEDAKAISAEIAKIVPELAHLKTPLDLKKAGIRMAERKAIGDRYLKDTKEVDRLIGNNKITVPSLGDPGHISTGTMGPSGDVITKPSGTVPMSLFEAVERLKALGHAGYGGGKDVPAGRTYAGRDSRQAWEDAIGEIKAELKKFNPTGEAVALFDDARRRFAVGITWLGMLKQGQVFRRTPEGPEMAANSLRGLFETKYSKFERSMLPDELAALEGAIYRGAPVGSGDLMASSTGRMSGAALQILRSGSGSGGLAALTPRTFLPNIGSQYAGRQPFALGNPAQTGIDLGVQRLVNPLLQGLGAPGLPE